MTAQRVFRLLWRFNALVVAAAGLAIIGGSVILVFLVYFEERRTEPVVKADTPPSVSQELVFGDFGPVTGTSTVLIPLEQEASTPGFASSGHPSSVIRNLLFIDLSSGEQRWLIEGRNTLIPHYRLIERHVPRGEKAEVIAILVEVVNADTDGDGHLDTDDRLTLAFAKPDGTGYTEAIMDIDRLLGSLQMGDDLVVGFERKGRYNIATVRLSDFRVAATHVIKKPALKK